MNKLKTVIDEIAKTDITVLIKGESGTGKELVAKTIHLKSHKKLDVWQTAMKTTQMVYESTKGFPEEEKFGLVSQMRRVAVSIPCNIAEGAARQGKKEFKNFLSLKCWFRNFHQSAIRNQ